LPLKPYPGSEGHTTWNASAAFPPKATGSVSGPMTFPNSTMEPGQPCVMTSGSAPSSAERACTKWMSMPSIPVTNWGSRLSRASVARQSYRSSQYSQSWRT
jgi:hypothetical protein